MNDETLKQPEVSDLSGESLTLDLSILQNTICVYEDSFLQLAGHFEEIHRVISKDAGMFIMDGIKHSWVLKEYSIFLIEQKSHWHFQEIYFLCLSLRACTATLNDFYKNLTRFVKGYSHIGPVNKSYWSLCEAGEKFKRRLDDTAEFEKACLKIKGSFQQRRILGDA